VRRQLLRLPDRTATACPGSGHPPAEWMPWNYRETLARTVALSDSSAEL
jgi:hypothetical protein